MSSPTGVNSNVQQIAAPVLGALVLAVAERLWTLRSQADGGDLRCICTEHYQRALDHIGSTLPKCEVVFGTATLVAVAFNAELEIRVLVEKLGMRLYHILIGGYNGVRVVRVVHATLGQQAPVVLQ